jgi:4-amino-4-deoxy-L-arabinose transferase-like glycosyltransferase
MRLPHPKGQWLILLICAAALLATAAFAAFAFERLPHLEDEVAYLFQARTMALGRLTVPSPAQPDSFWTPFVLDYEGQRFGKYTPGWPAMLTLGARAGLPWLVNPLLAAIALYLVYRLGETFYDRRTGLLAAALGLCSPLFLVLGGSFLSHIASMVWLLLFSLWFVWTVRGRRRWFALGAGLALGAAFLVRPLTAVAWAAPFVIYTLFLLIRRRASWAPFLLMAAGAAVLAALLPLYQWAVTGNPLLNPYTLWWPYDRVGFGPGFGAMPGGHSLHYAWLNLRQDLSRAATDLFGWPGLSWLPVLLGLALAPRRRRDWALLAPFACLVTAYLFYWIGSPSRLWGPRYYFEGFSALWVMGAVGLVKAWDWAAARPRWVRIAGASAVACLLAADLALLIPARAREAHGFYGISRAQYQPILEANLHDTLVIVYADRWLEYGAMLGEMSPMLDGDVVYARGSSSEADAAVIAQYPSRTVYYLTKGRLSTAAPPP